MEDWQCFLDMWGFDLSYFHRQLLIFLVLFSTPAFNASHSSGLVAFLCASRALGRSPMATPHANVR